MIDILKIQEVVKIIPSILEYFVPGFIFITIRNYCYSKNNEKDKYIVLKSIVISFIIMQISQVIVNIFKWNEVFISYISIIIAIISTILYIRFKLEAFIIEKLLGENKTPNEDYFDNIIPGKKGAWMRVYINQEVIYMGKILYYEGKETGEDRKIALSNFISYSYEDSEEWDNHSADDDGIVLISMKNINRMEIFK